ncbi:peptidoglycan recognition protein 3 [Anoplolepis gracilipes]|uniref:peptidoglycan recognition protein 3 n=1 Tax=Anoplolepis gracilipes TaxID=354296 RepID=UPI003BA1D06D
MRSSSYLVGLFALCILVFEDAEFAILIDRTNFVNPIECPRIVSRSEWKARERLKFQILSVTPTPYVVVHHGGIRKYCRDQETCSAIVRSYQNFHMDDRGWWDIGYNFLIGEDGNAYEGRGWDYVGAHAPGYNTQSIGICILGDFSDFLPNSAALNTLDALIACGISLGKISDKYNVIGHRQTRNTECPGESFYEYVINLPRWTANPIPIYSTTTTTEVTVKRNDTVEFIVLQVKMYIVKTTTLIFATVYVTLVAQETIASNSHSIFYLYGLNVITRTQWGARAPKSPAANLKTKPAPNVIIHHSTGPSCETQAKCQLNVRGIQNEHMNNRRWSDIGYNFLVGEDGNVYEGRGWGKKGAHSVPFNSKSIGICIIGNYSNRTPKAAAIEAVAKLIARGVDNGEIKSNYKLLGHRQTWPTACPGDSFYTMLQSWPHWTETAK